MTEEQQPAPQDALASDRMSLRGALLLAAGSILALAALGALAWFGYQQTTSRRLAVDRLDEATALVEAADSDVVAIDDVVRAEITSDIATRAVELAARIPETRDALNQAIDLVERAKPDLPKEELAKAGALLDSARYRLEMLEYAPVILDASAASAAALDEAEKAWDAVLDAEQLADQAIAEYNKLTKDSVSRSSTLTAEAERKLAEAKAGFERASKAMANADLGQYTAYVDEKVALLAISKKADTAFLAGKPAEANTLSTQFNAKEKEVVALAEKLPDSPATVVADAYEKLASEATTKYLESRGRATEADARLQRAQESAE